MNRIERCHEKYEKLFQNELKKDVTDPEFMDILQRFIFGQTFYTGDLDDQTRELITVIVLSSLQALPQLKGHTNAALNIGVTPIEIREAVYMCGPFLGVPRTLNAISTINEVFKQRNINLPLDNQTTIEDNQRYEKGLEIQYPLYGNEIKEKYKDLPNHLGDNLAQYLTEFCFGDFYTRKGLDIQTRELLVLCMLATLGFDQQIYAHGIGNLKVGNSLEMQYTALIHCIAYIGFPNVFNAINILRTIKE